MSTPERVVSWSVGLQEPTRVAVTVATRERPDSCRRLVDGILGQQIPPGQSLRLVVVDNASEPSELGLPSDDRLIVVHEPETGIPFARNRGVREAIGWADVIVFVDDDEVPAHDRWLEGLVSALEDHHADAATGPVESAFPPGQPAWIRRHPVFHRPAHPTGSLRPQAFTHNLAVRAEVFAELTPWFDERLRFTGGSDTELTRRAVRAGRTIVWTKEAAVREHVAEARCRMRWVLRRSLRLGMNRTQRLMLDRAPARHHVLYAAGAVAEILGGAALAALTPLVGRTRGLVGLGRACRGAGTLSAMLTSASVDEYRSVV